MGKSVIYSKKSLISTPLWLVIVNGAVLLVGVLTAFFTGLAGHRLNIATAFLDLPAGGAFLLRPWSPVTYMFTQTDVLHCLFNMLWLYWFGSLWMKFSSSRRLVWLYIVSGLGGALTFIILTLAGDGHPGLYLEGASAAVLGIVTATAIMIPDFKLNLMLLGFVRLKWIAVATVILYILGGAGLSNAATWAHLGGVIAGAAYALWLKYVRLRPQITDRRSLTEAEARAELDSLLDKVRTSGYGSLTANERRRLFELSHRV